MSGYGPKTPDGGGYGQPAPYGQSYGGPPPGHPDAPPFPGPLSGFPDDQTYPGPQHGFPGGQAYQEPQPGFPGGPPYVGSQPGFPGGQGYPEAQPGFPGGPPYGGPQPGYPAPYPPPAPARRRRSRLPLYLGLVAAVLLPLIAVIIVSTHVVDHASTTSDTKALYAKVGKPKGFDQHGEPDMRSPGHLVATLTATRTDSYDPVQATTKWLDEFGGDNPPTVEQTTRDFTNPNGPQFVSVNGFAPHSVSLEVSSSGSTYTILVDIIY
ncbi:MAG: hypothetical protein WCA46_01240 [Actinocatenispora sp.]